MHFVGFLLIDIKKCTVKHTLSEYLLSLLRQARLKLLDKTT
jgi:hypothetical protein